MTSIEKVKRCLELSIRFNFSSVVPLQVSFAVGLDSYLLLYLSHGVQAPFWNGSQSLSLVQSHLNSSEEPYKLDRA